MAEANQPEAAAQPDAAAQPEAAADAAPAENVPNLVKDEETGEMVSKK